jgi:hypothetical protein
MNTKKKHSADIIEGKFSDRPSVELSLARAKRRFDDSSHCEMRCCLPFDMQLSFDFGVYFTKDRLPFFNSHNKQQNKKYTIEMESNSHFILRDGKSTDRIHE